MPLRQLCWKELVQQQETITEGFSQEAAASHHAFLKWSHSLAKENDTFLEKFSRVLGLRDRRQAQKEKGGGGGMVQGVEVLCVGASCAVECPALFGPSGMQHGA